jgi:hypothetical protein
MAEEKYIFAASRWTRGNRIFPTRIEISPERVTRIKPHLIGSEEESIAISKVASVRLRLRLLWSDIRIESTGGTDPILSQGHRKEDARRIRDLIEHFQQAHGEAEREKSER